MEISVLLSGWGWDYDQLRAGWTEIEELGYDACYFGDDLFTHPEPGTPCYDPWSLLPAMAETTKRLKIGSLVSPVGRRHPGVFAKMATTTDIISRGRLIVGRGLGNMPEQQRTFHQPFPGPAERARMLKEELTIMSSLWTKPSTTFKGEFFQVDGAISNPKPVSKPHPEILIAFSNATQLGPVAAEFAQRVNLLNADDEQVKGAIEALAEHCASYGRDISDIVLGRCATIVFTDQPVPPSRVAEVLAERARENRYVLSQIVFEHSVWVLSYVGPPEQCADILLERTAKLGIQEIVVCTEATGAVEYERRMRDLRTFAREVAPALKKASINGTVSARSQRRKEA